MTNTLESLTCKSVILSCQNFGNVSRACYFLYCYSILTHHLKKINNLCNKNIRRDDKWYLVQYKSMDMPFCNSTHRNQYLNKFVLLRQYACRLRLVLFLCNHFNDVITCAMASQITSLTIVYSTLNLRHRSKKTSTLRVTGICERNLTGDWWIPRTKGQ